MVPKHKVKSPLKGKLNNVHPERVFNYNLQLLAYLFPGHIEPTSFAFNVALSAYEDVIELHENGSDLHEICNAVKRFDTMAQYVLGCAEYLLPEILGLCAHLWRRTLWKLANHLFNQEAVEVKVRMRITSECTRILSVMKLLITKLRSKLDASDKKHIASSGGAGVEDDEKKFIQTLAITSKDEDGKDELEIVDVDTRTGRAVGEEYLVEDPDTTAEIAALVAEDINATEESEMSAWPPKPRGEKQTVFRSSVRNIITSEALLKAMLVQTCRHIDIFHTVYALLYVKVDMEKGLLIKNVGEEERVVRLAHAFPELTAFRGDIFSQRYLERADTHALDSRKGQFDLCLALAFKEVTWSIRLASELSLDLDRLRRCICVQLCLRFKDKNPKMIALAREVRDSGDSRKLAEEFVVIARERIAYVIVSLQRRAGGQAILAEIPVDLCNRLLRVLWRFKKAGSNMIEMSLALLSKAEVLIANEKGLEELKREILQLRRVCETILSKR